MLANSVSTFAPAIGSIWCSVRRTASNCRGGRNGGPHDESDLLAVVVDLPKRLVQLGLRGFPDGEKSSSPRRHPQCGKEFSRHGPQKYRSQGLPPSQVSLDEFRVDHNNVLAAVSRLERATLE